MIYQMMKVEVKVPNTTVLLSISLLMFVNICLVYLVILFGCLCIYNYYVLLLHWSLYYYAMPVSASSYSLCFKVYFGNSLMVKRVKDLVCHCSDPACFWGKGLILTQELSHTTGRAKGGGILFYTSIDTQAFIFPFAWNIFSFALLSAHVSLDLKCVFYRQHIYGFLKIHSVTRYFWLGNLTHLHLKWLLTGIYLLTFFLLVFLLFV